MGQGGLTSNPRSKPPGLGHIAVGLHSSLKVFHDHGSHSPTLQKLQLAIWFIEICPQGQRKGT